MSYRNKIYLLLSKGATTFDSRADLGLERPLWQQSGPEIESQHPQSCLLSFLSTHCDKKSPTLQKQRSQTLIAELQEYDDVENNTSK